MDAHVAVERKGAQERRDEDEDGVALVRLVHSKSIKLLLCDGEGIHRCALMHDDTKLAGGALLTHAFAALTRPGTRPESVFFKSLYCLARDEGLPLKQEWIPALPSADRALVATALNQPADSLVVPASDLARLTTRLEAYLAGEHELIID